MVYGSIIGVLRGGMGGAEGAFWGGWRGVAEARIGDLAGTARDCARCPLFAKTR